MELTYYTSGGSGDGGDQYTGLDRFGRVVDQRWDISGTDVERLKYGYDRASNRVWRQNTVAGSGQDEYYTQDGLYQLTTLQRGTLNTGHTGITGTPGWEEDFNYDPLGNWHGSSSGYLTKVAGTTTLSQNRSHSKVNAISGLTTATGTAWASPAQDAAGNLTTVPRPLSPASGYTLKYDAWNRLVSVKAGSTVVATYGYDGANRRVTKTTANTRHYYYDDRWRVVEERLDSATSADRRFVWGIRRLDDLILRDREYGGGGDESSSSSTGGEGLNRHRLYAVDDLANVTALVDRAGAVLERYGYNGFGGVRYLTASFGSRSTSLYDWETLFASYRYDTDTGIYLARFRYFHPLLGRWLSRDPIQEQGGLNLYAYVGNNTINFYDPLGLWTWGGVLLGAAAVVAVTVAVVATGGAAAALVPVLVGASVGGISGVAGSLLHGGSFGDAVVSGLTGAALGAVAGLLPPAAGLVGAGAVGALSGIGGDLIGQVYAQRNNLCIDINPIELLGAGIGGAAAGVAGAGFTLWATAQGASDLTAATLGGLAGVIPSVMGPAYGQAVGDAIDPGGITFFP
jgi:RHS repeat-associated protein